jgi:cold shock CspA family protein
MVTEALAAAREAFPARHIGESLVEPERDVAFGDVDVVQPEKGFGFLVDEFGTRRHFKLRSRAIKKGDRVRFVPTDAPKGPAAKDVVRV